MASGGTGDPPPAERRPRRRSSSARRASCSHAPLPRARLERHGVFSPKNGPRSHAHGRRPRFRNRRRAARGPVWLRGVSAAVFHCDVFILYKEADRFISPSALVSRTFPWPLVPRPRLPLVSGLTAHQQRSLGPPARLPSGCASHTDVNAHGPQRLSGWSRASSGAALAPTPVQAAWAPSWPGGPAALSELARAHVQLQGRVCGLLRSTCRRPSARPASHPDQSAHGHDRGDRGGTPDAHRPGWRSHSCFPLSGSTC